MARHISQALLIISAVAFCYHGILDYPFLFDDIPHIQINDAIKDVSNIGGLLAYNPARFLVFLSFAVNYHFGGLDTFGYHLFNIAVHMVNSLLVMAFGMALVTAWRGREAQWPWTWLPFFSAIVFAVHPLHTGAVTYTCQRSASMVALLYLSAMTLYLSAAIASKETNQPAKFRYAGALICATLAMFTKQTAATLPIALVMLDFFFIASSERRERIRRLAPFFIIMLIGPLMAVTGMDRELGDIADRVETMPSHTEYFLTQLNVIVTYLRLIALPVNQNLDYDYPIAHSISDSALSAGILLGLLALAVAFYRRERMISFGILFFFLALSVESSVFPLEDVIFEHRAYLPSAGIIIAFWAGLFYTLEKLAPVWSRKKSVVVAMTLTLTALTSGYAAATINRNEVWRDGEALWTDVVKKSQGKARPHNNLGAFYFHKGDLDKAEKYFRQSLAINPKYALSLYDMALLNLKRGDLDTALDYFDKAVTIDPLTPFPLFSMGEGYLKRGMTAEAVKCYRLAVKLKPGIPKGWQGLVHALDSAGDKQGAQETASEVLRRWPEARKDSLIRDLTAPDKIKPAS
ncbi:MAG: tetratricopeptide repeat protein [Nitrospinae bacterium]|nr:tetratricopeptide repeat protein [Nitrospinota bacterium]MBF0633675.1 tetratricopeptide repeat protein [Nitrospinota bacterium]